MNRALHLNKVNADKLTKTVRFMSLALLLLIISFTTMAQLKPVYITGTITDSFTGMPFPHKQIFLESDTSNSHPLIYIDLEAFTSEQGIYTFTVETNVTEIHLIIYVIDCDDNRHDSSFSINVSELEPSHYTVNFDICKKVYGECIPDFEAELIDATEEHFIYQFYDKSESEVVSWKWKFGDGAHAWVQHPDHVYINEGLYDVTLVISNSLLPNIGCTDSITKQLNVGNNDYSSFGGHVFAGLFPIDLAYAYLFKYDGIGLIPVDTAIIDTLGFYYFYQVLHGDYIVKASPQPGSQSFGNYIPSYFGNKIFWEDASVIHLETTGWEYDIRLKALSAATQGDGNLSGGTFYVDTAGAILNPATNIEIFIFDENEQVCACTYSNYFGDFFFSQLSFGTYEIYAEVPGAKVEAFSVTLSEENPDITDILIKINYDEVTYSIEENSSGCLEIANSVYPNPGQDIAYIDINVKRPTTYLIEVYDQVGHKVIENQFSSPAGLHSIPIDISSLDRGIYFFRVITEDRFSFIEKLIKL